MRKPLAVLAFFGALQLNAHAQIIDYSKYFSSTPTAVQSSRTIDPEFKIQMANAELSYDARKLVHFAEILANAQGMEYYVEEGKSARPYSETLLDLLKGASERDPAGRTLLEHIKANPAYFVANAIQDFYEAKKADASGSPIKKMKRKKIDGLEEDIAVIDKHKRGDISHGFTAMFSWIKVIDHYRLIGEKLNYKNCLIALEGIRDGECNGKKGCDSRVVQYARGQLEKLNKL